MRDLMNQLYDAMTPKIKNIGEQLIFLGYEKTRVNELVKKYEKKILSRHNEKRKIYNPITAYISGMPYYEIDLDFDFFKNNIINEFKNDILNSTIPKESIKFDSDISVFSISDNFFEYFGIPLNLKYLQRKLEAIFIQGYGYAYKSGLYFSRLILNNFAIDRNFTKIKRELKKLPFENVYGVKEIYWDDKELGIEVTFLGKKYIAVHPDLFKYFYLCAIANENLCWNWDGNNGWLHWDVQGLAMFPSVNKFDKILDFITKLYYHNNKCCNYNELNRSGKHFFKKIDEYN